MSLETSRPFSPHLPLQEWEGTNQTASSLRRTNMKAVSLLITFRRAKQRA
jgi:hypothetical protein